MRGLRAALLLVVAASALGCGRAAPRPVSEALDAFRKAVQGQDLDRLYCLMAGAAGSRDPGADPGERRAGFDRWALERYAEYEEGREQGGVELDEQGLVLVKLFGLGQGASVRELGSERIGADALVVHTEVRPGYSRVALSGLPPGATFYVSGTPAGRVRAIRIPSGPGEVTAEVLDRVRVDWTLLARREVDGCPPGWAVASARAVEGSEQTERVRWMF